MSEPARHTPLVRQARIAGLCYLVVIAGGLFVEGFVREPLIVAGDAAATIREIAAGEQLWRLGLAVHLLYLIAAALVGVILYGLLKPVQATLARAALVFTLVDVTIEAVSLLHLYVPLAMVEERGALGALGEGQRQALAYLEIGQFATGFGFALLFFAGFCTLTGVLIMRSRLMPRLIGVLMIAAGVCYFVNSLASILAPSVSNVLFPWILLPPFVGELSLALWLVVKGVRVRGTPRSG
ncbi:MAG: DUF4386 family protein [Streptosporangiales bacterium]|nr:DUF4386 family protein [Streptosporangiales bacterium]